MSVPSNLIPTRITQLPIAPVASEDSLMLIVYQGVSYQIRVGDLLSVAGVPTSRQVIAGTGLSGGGALSNNVTLSIATGGVGFTQLSASGVTPGTYGSGTSVPVFTVDSKGRVIAATTIPVAVSGYVPTTRQVIAGTGLTGGGALNANVTLDANLSNALPLDGSNAGSAGVSTAIARADHQHPAVDLADDDEVDGILGLSNGGTARSLVPNEGALIWCGADGLYVGPVGAAGQILQSNGVGQYLWVNQDTIDARSAATVRGGAANRVLFQTATGVTGFIAAPTTANTLLRWNGTSFEWGTVAGSGTVTSVNVSGGATGLTTTGGPVTSSGTITIDGTLNVANGGTGANNATTARANLGLGTAAVLDAGTAGGVATLDGTGKVPTSQLPPISSSVTSVNGQTGVVVLSASDVGAPATNGTGATGTWNISISGNAATATSATSATTATTATTANAVANAVTFAATGGAAAGSTFNGSAARTVDYSTVGAPKADGTGATGTWSISVSGNAATATTATTAGSVTNAVTFAATGGAAPGTTFNGAVARTIDYSSVGAPKADGTGATGTWSISVSGSAGSATTATTATNIAGGAANRIPYNTGAGTTGFIVAPTTASTTLTWNGSAFAWAAAASGASVSIGTTPPATPNVGDLWWSSETSLLSVYYNDGTSSQWVSTAIGAQGPAGPNSVSTSTASSITGIIKGSGGFLAASVAGTDYVAPGGALGTPSSGTLTNCTGLPVSTGVSGLGTGVATFLANPTSANLDSAVPDSTGSGALVFATSPTLVTPVLGTPTSGNLSNCTADGTNSVGFRDVPQNSQSGNYTLALSDRGDHIYHPAAAAAAVWTIPANASVAFPIGTAITFVNMSTNAVTISITTDTLFLAGTGTTGSRTLAQYGVATALKLTSTTWVISGSGLT